MKNWTFWKHSITFLLFYSKENVEVRIAKYDFYCLKSKLIYPIEKNSQVAETYACKNMQ